MHKIEFSHSGKVRMIPSQVEEMDEQQFVFFIDLVMNYLSGNITIEALKTKLVARLLDIRLGLMDPFLTVNERENVYAEIYRLGELCESFFEEIDQDGKKVKSFRLNFTRNFIPRVCGKYYGPADALADITFCEYRLAHSYYVAYINSHQEQDLNRMIAVLYRPRKSWLWIRQMLRSYDGQKRIPLSSTSNPLLLEARAREIASLPMAVRYGIFLYFSGCERFLSGGTILIDGREIDLSVIYEKSGEDSDSPDIGLIGILYSLAETKVFGSIAETDNQNLYDIMTRLYQVVKQAKAMEAKYNEK